MNCSAKTLADCAERMIWEDRCNRRAFDATSEMGNGAAVGAELAKRYAADEEFALACRRNRRYMPDAIRILIEEAEADNARSAVHA